MSLSCTYLCIHCTVGHKSHDTCFYVFLIEEGPYFCDPMYRSVHIERDIGGLFDNAGSPFTRVWSGNAEIGWRLLIRPGRGVKQRRAGMTASYLRWPPKWLLLSGSESVWGMKMKMAGKRGGGVAGNFPECCCYVFGDFMGFATFLLYGPFGAETSSCCRAWPRVWSCGVFRLLRSPLHRRPRTAEPMTA